MERDGSSRASLTRHARRQSTGLARSALPVISLALIVASAVPLAVPSASAADDLVLRVGVVDEMKTRNLLPWIASDVSTTDVLMRIYDRPIKTDPEGVLLPYIAKGVDFDEDGVFEVTEYGVFGERNGAASSLEVVAYYDFNGVRWHDGNQMTAWDLLFSYHLNAMNARFNTDLRVLYCSPQAPYESCGRQLGVQVLSNRNWEGEGTMAGDVDLRAAVQFRLSESFALFYESTLAPILLPLNLWQRTGGDRHSDFGCAIWLPPTEAGRRGVPECGNTDPSKWGQGIEVTESVPGSRPYNYAAAESWNPGDEDVIGSGPFSSLTWLPGVSATVRRYDDYYVGGPYDPRISTYLHLPRVSEIRFLVYRTTIFGIFALRSGEIDLYHRNVGPYWIPEIIPDPNIAVESNAEPGFFYMMYNFRREPWGYVAGNTSNDGGYWFRQAVSHLVDKKSIVQNLLQNFGVAGHGVVSPANAFWYNDSIPKPSYDPTAARAILDDPTKGGSEGVGADPTPSDPGDCAKDTPQNCRTLRLIGRNPFEILVPNADYDPVRAAAGAMIAEAMRQVGINAMTGSYLPYSPFCQRDFDLVVLGWRISGLDPDYLFGFFHSSNWPCGQNYPGVHDATLDAVLETSRREMNRTSRRELIHEAQGLLADIRPYEVLYYQTNIEPYRQDRFVNWSVVAGTIWNEWSLFGIRPPGSVGLQLGLAVPTSVRAGASEDVSFSVRSLAGDPIEGATIDVRVETPAGEDPGLLRHGAQEGPSVVVTTDAGGRARVTYTAPTFYEGARPVVLSALAGHPAFEQPATEDTIVTVMGLDKRFMDLRIELPIGDVATRAAPFPIRLSVRDEDAGWIHDATVAVGSVPVAAISPSNGTAADMATIIVTFPSNGTYRVTATASGVGHEDALAFVDVWVADSTMPPPIVPPVGGPNSTAAAVAFVGFAALATTSALVLWRRVWRRRPDRRGSAEGRARPPAS